MPDERRIEYQRQDQFAQRIFYAGQRVRHGSGHRRHKPTFRRRLRKKREADPPRRFDRFLNTPAPFQVQVDSGWEIPCRPVFGGESIQNYGSGWLDLK